MELASSLERVAHQPLSQTELRGVANLLGLIKLLEVIAKYVFNLINVVHPLTIVIKNT